MRTDNSLVSSLRWLPESQQGKLVALLTSACQSIINEWRCGADSAAGMVSISPVSSTASMAGSFFEIVSDAGRLMTIRLGADSLRQLLNLPVGSVVSAGESNTLLGGLERDFVEAFAWQIVPPILAPGLCVRSNAPSEEEIAVKRSRQTFVLTSGRHASCSCLTLEAKLVDQLLPRVRHKANAIPSSRRHAIGEQSVSLKAHVGQVEVSFRALQSLVPGDVLVLEAPLSQAISLQSETGDTIAMGNLGQQDQRRVIRLSSIAANGQMNRINAAKRSI